MVIYAHTTTHGTDDMTKTTERIDVLAVMDELIENEAQECAATITLRRRAARAAVAELIEADREYDAALHIVETYGWGAEEPFPHIRRLDLAKERRAAALASVGAP